MQRPYNDFFVFAGPPTGGPWKDQNHEEALGLIRYFITPELLFRTPAGRPGPVANTKKSFEHKKSGTGFYGKSIEIHDSDRPQKLIN